MTRRKEYSLTAIAATMMTVLLTLGVIIAWNVRRDSEVKRKERIATIGSLDELELSDVTLAINDVEGLISEGEAAIVLKSHNITAEIEHDIREYLASVSFISFAEDKDVPVNAVELLSRARGGVSFGSFRIAMCGDLCHVRHRDLSGGSVELNAICRADAELKDKLLRHCVISLKDAPAEEE